MFELINSIVLIFFISLLREVAYNENHHKKRDGFFLYIDPLLYHKTNFPNNHPLYTLFN
jgi:hypothetical protein